MEPTAAALVDFEYPVPPGAVLSECRLTGDFFSWGKGIVMLRSTVDGVDAFRASLRLRVGATLNYKYLVDGCWKISEAAPTTTDARGIVNNVLTVERESPASPPPRRGTASCMAGTPRYTMDSEKAAALTISPGTVAESQTYTNYIGKGVIKEHIEEYGLDVEEAVTRHGGARSLMIRSASMSVLNDSSAPLSASWRRSAQPPVSLSLSEEAFRSALEERRLASEGCGVSVSDDLLCSHGGGAESALVPPPLAHNSTPPTSASEDAKGDAGGGAATPARSSLARRAVGLPVVVWPPPVSVGAVSADASRITPEASSSTPCPSPMNNVQALLKREGKLVVAMVGLPARGKTFMARRLKRHLLWMGYRVEIFNVGNYRRKLVGALQTHSFFDPENKDGEAARSAVALLAFNEMVSLLLTDELDIAIFDATNTTVERRQWVASALAAASPSFRCIFLELICNDEALICNNVRETKLKSPDYVGVDEAVAVSDFLARIEHYKTIYQPLGERPEEKNTSYIKLIDVGKMMICNNITGFLNSRILFFCNNLNIAPPPVWLTRHGESEFNVQGRIGGDSGLSPRGISYSHRLAAFFNNLYPKDASELVVWTSTLRRTHMTAAGLGREIVAWKALDEIDAGVCDGMTYETIAATMPDEYAARAKSKYSYRYPRGESYQDMAQRLEPIIIELMRQRTPVLIVSHQATLRVLYAYILGRDPQTCPDVLMPLHSVIEIKQHAYGAEEQRHELLAGVGTH